jgi:hypothetical protein
MKHVDSERKPENETLARTVEEKQKMKCPNCGKKPANLNVVISKINHLNVVIIYCYSNFLI